jgi:hypothetical protein
MIKKLFVTVAALASVLSALLTYCAAVDAVLRSGTR